MTIPRNSSRFEYQSRKLMKPTDICQEARKRRSELCDRMSEWPSKSISIASWSCLTIGISSCRDNKDIWFVDSFCCRDWIVPIFSIINSWYAFSIMNIYLIAILLKYILKHSYNIPSIIRDGENAIVFLAFQWYSMRLEPFLALLRRKFPKCIFYKFPTSRIFCLEYFFIYNSCCYIAPTTSWENDFLSRRSIFFEKMYTKLSSSFLRRQESWSFFKYYCSTHEPSSSGSYDRNCFHAMKYIEKYWF